MDWRLYFNGGGIHDSNSEQFIIGVYMTLFFTFSRVKEIWIPPFWKIERAAERQPFFMPYYNIGIEKNWSSMND